MVSASRAAPERDIGRLYAAKPPSTATTPAEDAKSQHNQTPNLTTTTELPLMMTWLSLELDFFAILMSPPSRLHICYAILAHL